MPIKKGVMLIKKREYNYLKKSTYSNSFEISYYFAIIKNQNYKIMLLKNNVHYN